MSPASSLVARMGAAAAVSALLGGACSRDHSSLAQEPTGSGGAGGGATASVSIAVAGTTTAAGFGGSDGAGGSPSTSSGDGGDGQGGVRPEEPDGPTRLVVVHGIADRDRVAFCFATPDGDGIDVAPFPDGGLAFAGVRDVDVETLPTGSDVVVMAVAGAEDDLADASCADLLDDPGASPDLEVVALGQVPASALGAPRILVLAATGCMGGEEHENELQEQACGVGYGPLSPTVSLVAASPSRIAPDDRVGFQSIGASVPAASFDVILRPIGDGSPFLITKSLSWGAAAPFPPAHDRTLAQVGVPSQLTAVVTLPDDDETVLAEIDLGDAAERAGLTTFHDGGAYTIAFVGASPGLGEGPWWHAFDAVFIPPDP